MMRNQPGNDDPCAEAPGGSTMQLGSKPRADEHRNQGRDSSALPVNHPGAYTEEEKAMLREAAEWFVRVHDEASLEDIAAWQAWLDKSDAHREAFRRIEEAWALAGKLPR